MPTVTTPGGRRYKLPTGPCEGIEHNWVLDDLACLIPPVMAYLQANFKNAAEAPSELYTLMYCCADCNLMRLLTDEEIQWLRERVRDISDQAA